MLLCLKRLLVGALHVREHTVVSEFARRPGAQLSDKYVLPFPASTTMSSILPVCNLCVYRKIILCAPLKAAMLRILLHKAASATLTSLDLVSAGVTLRTLSKEVAADGLWPIMHVYGVLTV